VRNSGIVSMPEAFDLLAISSAGSMPTTRRPRSPKNRSRVPSFDPTSTTRSPGLTPNCSMTSEAYRSK
jgi:hypothetical protein